MVESVMTLKPAFKPLAAALAVLALAACEHNPPPQPTASAQPVPEGGTIEWKTPRPGETPSAGTTTGDAGGRLPPGSTIQWKDQAPSGSESTAGLPPGATWKDQGASGPPAAAPAPRASAQPVSPSAPAQPGPPINWRGGLDGNVLQIEILDRFGHYRVDRVSLISPQGQEYVSRDLTYFAPSYGRPGASSNVGVGVSSWGGSSSGTSVGVGLGFPLGGFSSSREDPDLYAPRTVARIPLPDPDGYRINPGGWTVRVRLIDAIGEASVAQFPAPLPARP